MSGDVMSFNLDAVPKPNTLYIRMTRGQRRIADELHKAFGDFERVVIDVDGEQHEFRADSLVQMLESYEGARDTSRYAELFGTPERAARTLANLFANCNNCFCFAPEPEDASYDAILELLRGDA